MSYFGCYRVSTPQGRKIQWLDTLKPGKCDMQQMHQRAGLPSLDVYPHLFNVTTREESFCCMSHFQLYRASTPLRLESIVIQHPERLKVRHATKYRKCDAAAQTHPLFWSFEASLFGELFWEVSSPLPRTFDFSSYCPSIYFRNYLKAWSEQKYTIRNIVPTQIVTSRNTWCINIHHCEDTLHPRLISGFFDVSRPGYYCSIQDVLGNQILPSAWPTWVSKIPSNIS